MLVAICSLRHSALVLCDIPLRSAIFSVDRPEAATVSQDRWIPNIIPRGTVLVRKDLADQKDLYITLNIVSPLSSKEVRPIDVVCQKLLNKNR